MVCIISNVGTSVRVSIDRLFTTSVRVWAADQTRSGTKDVDPGEGIKTRTKYTPSAEIRGVRATGCRRRHLLPCRKFKKLFYAFGDCHDAATIVVSIIPKPACAAEITATYRPRMDLPELITS